MKKTFTAFGIGLALTLKGATAMAQDTPLLSQKITLTPQVKVIEEHFKDLQVKGININYAKNHLNTLRPIRLVKETGSLRDLLNDILREQPLQIIEKHNAIYLARPRVIPPPPPEVKKGKNYIKVGDPF